MPAFRQVGEKQLPNPVLCMAWSPKRDLIALANTTGEVKINIICILKHDWCLSWFCNFWFSFVPSCCCIAWLVSSVFGVYHPVNILGRRSLRSPGDLMAKVRNSSCFLVFWLQGPWGYYNLTFSSIHSFGIQPGRHQASGAMWRWESRDPPRVSGAASCDLHALDGGDGGEQVSTRHRHQTRDMENV